MNLTLDELRELARYKYNRQPLDCDLAGVRDMTYASAVLAALDRGNERLARLLTKYAGWNMNDFSV